MKTKTERKEKDNYIVIYIYIFEGKKNILERTKIVDNFVVQICNEKLLEKS